MPKRLEPVLIAAEPDIAALTVALTWAEGDTTVADFAPLVGQGVFAAFAEPDFFARVRVGERGRSLEWPGELEFCADALWAETHPRAYAAAE